MISEGEIAHLQQDSMIIKYIPIFLGLIGGYLLSLTLSLRNENDRLVRINAMLIVVVITITGFTNSDRVLEISYYFGRIISDNIYMALGINGAMYLTLAVVMFYLKRVQERKDKSLEI